jgi:hypothetical protein
VFEPAERLFVGSIRVVPDDQAVILDLLVEEVEEVLGDDLSERMRHPVYSSRSVERGVVVR